MRYVLAAALLSTLAIPAYAQSAELAQVTQATELRRNQTLLDANGAKIGTIDKISADGTVGLVVGTKYVRVPVSTITVVAGKATTSLTKKDLKAR